MITANTGDLKFSKQEGIEASALGSCIALIAYSCQFKMGAIAHIMLPGQASNRSANLENRYAQNAIENLIYRFYISNIYISEIEVCLVGGGNVLKRKDDKICSDLTSNIESILMNADIPVRARALGGEIRRSARLDVLQGKVFYTEGDHPEKLLYQFNQLIHC